jgi:hypothetical protein
MRIIDHEVILNFLGKENGLPKIGVEQIQIWLSWGCGCQVRQDDTASSLMPCHKHKAMFMALRDNKILHKHMH